VRAASPVAVSSIAINGNNGDDQTEGARTHNAIGTYMHGPVLPNNPALADGLLSLALQRQSLDSKRKFPDDDLVEQVRRSALARKY